MWDVPDVEVTTDGAVAIVTLQRPEVYNAFTLAMVRELRRELEGLTRDETVGAIVLTGAGKAFCSGGDVDEMYANLHRAEQHFLDLTADHHAVVKLLVEGPKPVVCAVNGVAAGGGYGLALCGDIRIASESARLKPAYFRLGVAPDGGSTWLLPRLVGMSVAQRILLHDRMMDAEEARALAAGPAFALAAAKRLLAATSSNDLETQLHLERRLNSASGGTPEFREGAAAFREKREPRFPR